MEFNEVKRLIHEAKDEQTLLEARAAAMRYSLFSGDTVGICKIYQKLQNKSRKLVNTKSLNQRLKQS